MKPFGEYQEQQSVVAVNCVFLTLDDLIFTPDYPLIQSNQERSYPILFKLVQSHLFVFVRERSSAQEKYF